MNNTKGVYREILGKMNPFNKETKENWQAAVIAVAIAFYIVYGSGLFI